MFRKTQYIVLVIGLSGILLFIYGINDIHTVHAIALSQSKIANMNNGNFSSWSYTPREGIIGLPFRQQESRLSRIGFPITNFIDIAPDNVGDFVFVTGSDEGFFHVDMDAIARVQHFFPNHTIYFYDLSDGKLFRHANKINQLQNVVYRWFNFDLYPEHVRNLQFYAWKPLIVHEVLLEHRGVFWFDASVRVHTGNLSVTVGPALATGGVLVFTTGGRSVFELTHEGMIKYLGISKSLAVNTTMREAGDSLFYRTEFDYKNIVRCWVLCALEKECIAPTTELKCTFHGPDVWAGCHRFDQSALNILLANAFPYEPETSPIYVNPGAGITIDRGSRDKEMLVIRRKSVTYFGT